MKALFITTHTNDVYSLIRAWECWNAEPASWIKFDYTSKRSPDTEIIASAQDIKPDIIFYIGACTFKGTPSTDALKTLRNLAPSIHICCDAGDPPWHEIIDKYRRFECFDKQVGIDGVQSAPVDLVTLTPVDPRPYSGVPVDKTIKCGFSGGIGKRGLRYDLVQQLQSSGILSFRNRNINGGYDDHVSFLQSCHVVLNTAWSGTGSVKQVKGRVLETAFAGSALLEHADAPTVDLFPRNSIYTYTSAKDAKEIIRFLDTGDARIKSEICSDFIRKKWNAPTIYRQIMEGVIDVDTTE